MSRRWIARPCLRRSITTSWRSPSLPCSPHVRRRGAKRNTRRPRARVCRNPPPARCSKRNPAYADVLEHHPVAHQAVERMPEGGGPVLLEKEMAHPCTSVTTDERGGKLEALRGRARLDRTAARHQ